MAHTSYNDNADNNNIILRNRTMRLRKHVSRGCNSRCAGSLESGIETCKQAKPPAAYNRITAAMSSS